MKLTEVVKIVDVVEVCSLSTKKQLFSYLAEKVQLYYKEKGLDLSSEKVISKLNEREHEGSTSLGNFVAIPHAKLCNLNTAIGFFVKLKRSINFGQNSDEAPVKMVFALFAPKLDCEEDVEADQVKLTENQLQKIARFFKSQVNVEHLLAAETSEQIWSLLEDGS